MGSLGLPSVIHPAILKAASIQPAAGSSFYDAEHVVILMQENRSFDHCFGTLKGVRGFNDPRAFRKADGHSVLFQKNTAGQYFAPFHLDIKNTKATWMQSLPHSWEDQIDARNGGKFDQWLPAKASGVKEYRDMPLTMGYYSREDLPFYYQLADAFTVCDQNFSSSLTGTSPNRLFLWSGSLRSGKTGDFKAIVRNEEIDYTREAHWKTYPEVLEENGISWKIYQNEISLPKGLFGEKDAYLSNFTDNPLEWFSQYKVRFSLGYYEFAKEKIAELQHKLKLNPADENAQRELDFYSLDIEKYAPENFKNLTEKEKHLHQKAFAINNEDPNFHEIVEFQEINGEKMHLPKGDILHQFRKDTENGTLPTVSWIVAPERFSDHPTSPWYGAWYISEVMNILTKNPEVWKKTIFILTYDENDGYFDHAVTFSPPENPSQQPDIHGEEGIEYVDFRQKYFEKETRPINRRREGPVGLGYRVPMVVASPWSRGGVVNSEVTDHTSVLQFLEHFLAKKTGRSVNCDLISHWRREVCGDLTSCFTSEENQKTELNFLNEEQFVASINSAKNKPLPNNFVALNPQDLKDSVLPRQEKGVKPSSALSYNYLVNYGNEGVVMENLTNKAVPLVLYDREKLNSDSGFHFPYALYGNQKLVHQSTSKNLEIYGPNGFYRNFKIEDQGCKVSLLNDKKRGDIILVIENNTSASISIFDNYTKKTVEVGKGRREIAINSLKMHGWYDLKVTQDANIWHFAGRCETGKLSVTDPIMGGLL